MLGRYRLDAVIGRGGMGVVFRAVDERLDRTVAVKVLAPDLVGDPLVQERFLREARVAAAIEHPHIVPVFEAASSGGVDYIAMRFVPGSDLGRVLRREAPLDPIRTLGIVEQVADALDAAHARGLVHRDVKPSNVLLEDRGQEWAWLSDFGLTKRMDGSMQLTREGLVGTLEYIAPEVIERGMVDGRSDQYALACVAYHCLAGRPPFMATSEARLLHAHLHETAPPIAGVGTEPDRVDDAIRRGLAKVPAARYQSCRAFADELRRAVEAAPIASAAVVAGGSPGTPGAPEGAAQSSRYGRLALAGRGRQVGSAMLLAGAVVGSVFLVARPREATRGLALLPSGSAAGSAASTVSPSDPAALSASVVPTPAAALSPARLTGPDGVIVFAGDRDGDFDIWAMRPDGTDVTRITRGPARERSPSVSADGTRIVYAVGRTGDREIWLIDTARDGDPRQLTGDGNDDFEPAISPDGRHIAWVSTRSDGVHRHIWLMTDEGEGFREGDATDLTDDPLTTGNHSQRPAWFPDNERIAFQTNDFDSADIWSVDLQGNREWWTRDRLRDFGPTVGLDDTIDFIHAPQASGPSFLYRVSERGGRTRRISDLPDPEDLDYAPDMRRLVVERGTELLTMSRDGDDRRTVTIPEMRDPTEPDWVESVLVPSGPG
jgi:serine/threonine-protein kinase